MIKNKFVAHIVASVVSAILLSLATYGVLNSSTSLVLPPLFSNEFWSIYLTLSVFTAVAGLLSCLLTQTVQNAGQKVALKAEGREVGTVKWFNTSKGFGFITRDNGDDVFVHYRSIRGKGHRFLVENQVVHFTLTEGDKGWQAEDVIISS